MVNQAVSMLTTQAISFLVRQERDGGMPAVETMVAGGWIRKKGTRIIPEAKERAVGCGGRVQRFCQGSLYGDVRKIS